ncbi:hypothetical protein [Deinococcus cellulosilyticus]|uniref:Uncharacterized protein n=1 Tax=Deinococcus cellulosilyticus (strain DSM 18568 / NBRC 106333 / KACC 11606 / 5516J-15) TaxID=1223518 RepID=A0A511N6W3_DEIC1|nr:hypothetical protein [Deinococcus cellulosilyticus]GEM48217.1 hypothetical protein DC3_38520 [Deinococcus cellulosilyticus NBRC 106333 = KACC 11606]
MKPIHTTLVMLLLGSASALNLEGTLKTPVKGNARLGVFVVNPSGTPQYEWSSTALSGSTFSIQLLDDPPTRGLWSLSADTLTWPGVVGNVKISGTTATTELKLFTYLDADGNKKHSSNEKLLDTSLMSGKANVVMVYVEDGTTITGEKGLNVVLKPGWNLVTLAGGKTLTTQVLQNIKDAAVMVLE